MPTPSSSCSAPKETPGDPHGARQPGPAPRPPPGGTAMTATSETVLDLLDALVRIDSVNPGLDPAGPGEAQIAAFVAEWGRRAGLRVTELRGTPGRPSVILRG